MKDRKELFNFEVKKKVQYDSCLIFKISKREGSVITVYKEVGVDNKVNKINFNVLEEESN